MSGTATPSPQPFWEPSSTEKIDTGPLPSLHPSRRLEALPGVDESPDFYDPFSDMNLFLVRKIKEQMRTFGSARKWSVKIQEDLLQKITPEFQKQFPQYRLGMTALKKTWEKIGSLLQQIQGQKEAISQEGKLNISFFIRENLKQFRRSQSGLHPYHFAHGLAVKLSECILAIDGMRPRIDELTKTIWAAQRHLLPKSEAQHSPCPYDEYDKIDKLIVRLTLEMTTQYPGIDQIDLEDRVSKALHELAVLSELPLSDLIAATQTVQGRMHNELARELIDHPETPLSIAIAQTAQYVKRLEHLKIKENWNIAQQKVHNWALQNDMLLQWIRLDAEMPLLKKIRAAWGTSLHHCIEKVSQEFIADYPHLASFQAHLQIRCQILYKYAWYHLFSSPAESSFERFLKWHQLNLLREDPNLSQDALLQHLENVCLKAIPLMPYDPSRLVS